MPLSRRGFLGSVLGAAAGHEVLWNTRNAWGQASSGKKAYAVCIGLGEVGGKFYQGWKGVLQGTLPDSELYFNEVVPNTFKKVQLKNREATTEAVYRHVLWAANDLQDGDIFVLTLASHGMEVQDDSGDERVNSPTDQYDEAWCLWDRPLLDDELNYMWSFFRRGVRIVLVLDACHTGTSGRNADALAEFSKTLPKLTFSLDGLKIEGRSLPDLSREPTMRAQVRRAADQANMISERSAGMLREQLQSVRDDGSVSLAEKVNRANRSQWVRNAPDFLAKALVEHDRSGPNLLRSSVSELKVEGGDGSRNAQVQASVLTLAACQDSETSLEDGSHGFFTSVLAEVWNRSTFRGSYSDFMATIQSEMRRAHGNAQHPFLDKFGGDLRFIDNQRPFTV